ncbi:MAG: hypothetical protein ACYTXY_15145, partial [Nostoc sp.]
SPSPRFGRRGWGMRANPFDHRRTTGFKIDAVYYLVSEQTTCLPNAQRTVVITNYELRITNYELRITP